MAANLRNIKRRIKSVGGIRQITRAMEMVAATRLKKSLDRVEKAKPYFDNMDKIIHHLVVSVGKDTNLESLHPLMKTIENKNDTLLVAIAAEKGLCAGFNTNIIRQTNRFIDSILHQQPSFRFDPPGGEINGSFLKPDFTREPFHGSVDKKGIIRLYNEVFLAEPGEYSFEYKYRSDEGKESSGSSRFFIHEITGNSTSHLYWTPKQNLYLPVIGLLRGSNVLAVKNIKSQRVIVLAIGKKIYEPMLKKNDPRVLVMKPELDFDQSMHIPTIDRITEMLGDLYISETVSEVNFLYTKYLNAARQVPVIERFLPMGYTGADDDEDDAVLASRDYLFEPSAAELLKHLVPAYARTKLYQALANSFTSEHSTRMNAMRNATDNAAELIDDLTLQRNKARQAAITKELSEIVGGAEALKSF